MKKFLRWLIIIPAMLLMLSGCSNGNSNSNSSSSSAAQSSQTAKKAKAADVIKVTYEIQQDGKTIDTKTIEQPKNSMVEDGLKKAWSVKETKGMVTSIDGKQQNQAQKKYWLYSINGKSATKGVAQQKVKAGDKVVFNLAAMK